MRIYEVFLKPDGKEEFRHAGSIEAATDELALVLARENYARRAEGTHMWLVNRENILDKYLDCNENLRGFGGMCLPKDTTAIAALVKQLNLDINFFDMILSENNKYKTTVFNGMRK